MRNFDVIGIGSATVDYLGIVPHYPEEDARLEMLDFTRQGGGSVATALVTLARLGRTVAYLGKIGDDESGRFVLQGLVAEGINTDWVEVQPGATQVSAFIMVNQHSGKRTILWTRQNKALLQPSEIFPAQIQAGAFLYLDEYDTTTAIAAGRMARQMGVPVVLDAESTRSGMDELIALADVLIASHDFACSFTDEADFKRAAQIIHRQLPETLVVVTAGAAGCYCISSGDAFQEAAVAVDGVDTTGCGGVFHGAFIYGLLEAWPLARTAEFACATAALKCRALGGRAGIPKWAEVASFLTARSGQASFWQGRI